MSLHTSIYLTSGRRAVNGLWQLQHLHFVQLKAPGQVVPGGGKLMWALARGQRGRAATSHSNVYSLPMRRERKILSEFHP